MSPLSEELVSQSYVRERSMISVAFYNLKGGVGKTTTAVNMAYLAAAAGKKTVLWDLDTQAAATWFFKQDGVKSRAIQVFSKGRPIAELEATSPFSGLTVIPADLSLRKMEQEFSGQSGTRWLRNLIKPLAASNDILIYDCRSEEHTSELQSRPHLV